MIIRPNFDVYVVPMTVSSFDYATLTSTLLQLKIARFKLIEWSEDPILMCERSFFP